MVVATSGKERVLPVSAFLIVSFGPRKVFDSTLKSEAGFNDKALCDQIYKRCQSLIEWP